MEQRLKILAGLGLFLLLIHIGQIEGDQGCPLPWNSCRHYCVQKVRTDKGRPCDGLCHRFTCVCLYGSACRYGYRHLNPNPNQSDENY